MNFYATILTRKNVLNQSTSYWAAMAIPPFPHGKQSQPKLLLVQTPLSFISIITRGPPSPSGPPVTKKSMASTGSGDRCMEINSTLSCPRNISDASSRTAVSPLPKSLLICSDLLSPEEHLATWSLLAVSRAYYWMHIRNRLISSKNKI